MEKLMNKMDNMELDMNKMDDMEMDKVSGGARGNRGNDVKKGTFSSLHGSMQNENVNSMAANVDETQMKLPIGGGHKITMAANVDAKHMVGK